MRQPTSFNVSVFDGFLIRTRTRAGEVGHYASAHHEGGNDMKKASKIGRVLGGLVVAGLLAACGGGGSDSGSSGENESSSGGGDVSIVTVADLPGVDDACEKVINMIGALGQVMSGQISTDAARAIVDDFVAAVPEEIRSDADVLVSAFTGYIDVLGEYGGDMAAAMADPEVMAALEKIGAAETNASTERINAYLTDKCGWAG
jgi:hypothetical protein